MNSLWVRQSLSPDHAVSGCYGDCLGETLGDHYDDSGTHHNHCGIGDLGCRGLHVAPIRPHLQRGGARGQGLEVKGQKGTPESTSSAFDPLECEHDQAAKIRYPFQNSQTLGQCRPQLPLHVKNKALPPTLVIHAR